MTLAEMWATSPENLVDKKVDQIIKFAGTGRLLDGNDCSAEFRGFLEQIPSSMLRRYSEECLATRFDDGGNALQDVLNEIGRRIGFEVHNGRHRGVTNQIGHDGLWRSDDGHAIVAESKTSAAYQIRLDAVVGYRKSLITEGLLTEEESSILIIVGREDTRDLEAQVRGSRAAWDIRLISVDSLLGLMDIQERLDDPDTFRKIREVLTPHEFTKVDEIIDLVFSTAVDLRPPDEVLEVEGDETERTPKFVPVNFHDACIARIANELRCQLLKRSRATFATADGAVAVVCAVSREHGTSERASYWFAFHPHHRDALQGAREPYVAFGCGSEDKTLLIPAGAFLPLLPTLNVTERADRTYWHVHIDEEGERLLLRPKAGGGRIDLTKYRLNGPGNAPARSY